MRSIIPGWGGGERERERVTSNNYDGVCLQDSKKVPQKIPKI